MNIKFSFNLDIYQKIFDDSIKGLLRIDNLKTNNILFNKEDYGKNGIEFEDIIIEQLWNNCFEF